MDVRAISDPSMCFKGLKIGETLGAGEVGVAYELRPGLQNKAISDAMHPSGKYVLKEVMFPMLQGHAVTKKAIANFHNEVSIGKYLGSYNVAPHIYASWMCNNTGYYIMDRMKSTWTDVYGPRTSDSGRFVEIQPDIVHELQLVYCLAKMISLGIIHQDCHPGNIGFTKDDDVVIFDFGFSVRADKPINYPEIMLMSQLYIVVQHWEKRNLYQSYLYKVIYRIRQGTVNLPDLLAETIGSMKKSTQAATVKNANKKVQEYKDADVMRKDMQRRERAARAHVTHAPKASAVSTSSGSTKTRSSIRGVGAGPGTTLDYTDK